MNALSFLIDIFHLIVIMSLESLKGMKYRVMLINISLAVMANTVSVFLSWYNFFHFNITAGQQALKILTNMVVASANFLGYVVFLVASIQKYLAICRPISYQSSSFVKHLPVTFELEWTHVVLVDVFLSLMEMLLPFQQSGAEEFYIAQMLVLSIPPNLLTDILLFNVFRQPISVLLWHVMDIWALQVICCTSQAWHQLHSVRRPQNLISSRQAPLCKGLYSFSWMSWCCAHNFLHALSSSWL